MSRFTDGPQSWVLERGQLNTLAPVLMLYRLWITRNRGKLKFVCFTRWVDIEIPTFRKYLVLHPLLESFLEESRACLFEHLLAPSVPVVKLFHGKTCFSFLPLLRSESLKEPKSQIRMCVPLRCISAVCFFDFRQLHAKLDRRNGSNPIPMVQLCVSVYLPPTGREKTLTTKLPGWSCQ